MNCYYIDLICYVKSLAIFLNAAKEPLSGADSRCLQSAAKLKPPCKACPLNVCYGHNAILHSKLAMSKWFAEMIRYRLRNLWFDSCRAGHMYFCKLWLLLASDHATLMGAKWTKMGTVRMTSAAENDILPREMRQKERGKREFQYMGIDNVKCAELTVPSGL